MLSLVKALKLDMARAFSITGRSTRAEYWWFMLFSLVVIIGFSALISFMMPHISYSTERTLLQAFYVVYLGLLILYIPLFIRRLHDHDMSAVWVILLLPSVILLVIGTDHYGRHFSSGILNLILSGALFICGVIIFCITVSKGSRGPNRYGADPLADINAHFKYYYTHQHKRFGAFGTNPFAQPGFQQAFQQPQTPQPPLPQQSSNSNQK